MLDVLVSATEGAPSAWMWTRVGGDVVVNDLPPHNWPSTALYTLEAVAEMLEAEASRIIREPTSGANEYYATQDRARELEDAARYLRQRREP